MKILNFAFFVAVYMLAELSQAQSVLTNGLLAYYPFRGNGLDASGHGYNGVVKGPVYVINRFGSTNSAIQFNGTNNNFEVDNLPVLNSNFTYSVWLNVSGPNYNGDNNQCFGVLGTPNHYWDFCYNLGGYFGLWDRANNTWNVNVTTNNPINHWVHVVVVYSSAGSEYAYCNGLLIGSRTVSLPIPYAGTNKFFIGSYDGLQGQSLKGSIGDVRIFSRALSSSEVASLYALESISEVDIILTQNLTNSFILYGQSSTIGVLASGGSPLTYQWFFTGTNNINQAGAYSQVTSGFVTGVVITNAGSNYGVPPSINFAGGGGAGAAGFANVSNGAITAITLTNAGGGYTNSPNVVIGSPNGFLIGQTNNTLTISNAGNNSIGNYYVIVSDNNGSITSSNDYLTLLYPPSITQNPVGFSASLHASNNLSVSVAGTPPLFYQWMLNGTNIYAATNAIYFIKSLNLTNIGAYSVMVTNIFGSITSLNANVIMTPSIVVPFGGAVGLWGHNTVLSVGAVGSGSLNYQWYFNGVPIFDGTNSTYVFNSIQFTNEGLYGVVVGSAYGFVTNTSYQVVVNPANTSIGTCPEIYISGTAGYNYSIQSSTNLADANAWVTLTNITLVTPMQIWADTSVDTSNPNNTRKFYRVLAGQ